MKRIIILQLIFIVLICNTNTGERGFIYGFVTNAKKNRLKGVKITLFNKKIEKTTFTNDRGFYKFNFLEPGNYQINYELKGYKNLIMRVVVETSSVLTLDVVLEKGEGGKNFISWEKPLIDYCKTEIGSYLDEMNFDELPNARNIWSLLENQEPSAVTNRIDVGGLWNGIPALFSSRGSCSWTQNSYLLNGMDVTNPYQPGLPLFYPDFESIKAMEVTNAGHSAEFISPGAYVNLITKEGDSNFKGGLRLYYINHLLQSSNLTPQLKEEGLREVDRFDYSLDGNFHLSGPIIKNKLYFFTSWTSNYLSRVLAGYKGFDKIRLYSGFLNLKYKMKVRVAQVN